MDFDMDFGDINWTLIIISLICMAGSAYAVFQGGTENIPMFWKIATVIVVPIAIYLLFKRKFEE